MLGTNLERLISTILIAALTLSWSAKSWSQEYLLRQFNRQQLTETYYSEGIAVGDINGDGNADVVYGPYWFAGPGFEEKHEIFEAKAQPMDRYANHFFAWTYDFNGDQAQDVFVVGFPGTRAYVYQNPGKGIGQWTKHQVFDWVSNESPQLVNLIGDDRPELVCTRDGFFGFATIDWDQPLDSWTFHPVSQQIADRTFGHGLGVGDVNGDGLLDMIHASGWFEQPSQKATDGRWQMHEVAFSNSYGGADMFAYDVDGDGLNDVITSEAAHDYGLSWYKQSRADGQVQFQRQVIMGKEPSDNKYGVLFTEPHSLRLADMDGDGLQDIITGKTYYSHHQKSPMWDAGAVVYWFQLVRNQQGVDWLPHKLDDTTGIGRQVVVADINQDGQLDVATGGMLGAHILLQQSRQVTAEEIRPVAIDGRQLNLDFEFGSLADWQAEGKAFQGQPIRGDTVSTRRDDSSSRHEGQFWIGGYEKLGDAPQGSLTSQPFLVTAPYASFLIGGGPKEKARAELMIVGQEKPFFAAAGKQVEDLSRVVVDLQPVQGKQMFIRLIDASSDGWGHINFDHFRFHQEQPAEPAAVDPPLVNDQYPHAGLAADQAAAAMQVPDGFRVIACAAEPDVKQPIAMALDDRGRTWIAEAYEYPIRAQGEQGRDRILIFEDTDGDGKFDSRKVFFEGLNLVSGLEVGFGGVWVGAAPYLMFIPDSNGDDLPDSGPKILLDGWGYQDTHETLNTFCWGPDGWLYGCHGIFTHSRVGKPQTPDADRVPINAGVWRYHPVRHEFEVFASGTSNPWGLDFNEVGEAFVTACVIPHLFHIIPEARYQRQAGRHFNKHTYANIMTIADHLHYLGATPHSGNNKSDSVGGGHAHAGAMIYQGAAWPEKYNSTIFMNNIHGQRLNVDRLVPKGSGYVGTHAPDFLLTQDQASQILNLRYGPDGQVIFIDWYDMQACHRKEIEVHDRSNGRIYKICYGDVQFKPVDLANLSDLQLADQALNPNDWFVRHSRRLLQERAAKGKVDQSAIDRLQSVAQSHVEVSRRLRAVWALHAVGAVDEALHQALLVDSSPHVRGWAVRLQMERQQHQPTNEQLAEMTRMAGHDDSPVVRLSLASLANRIPLKARWNLLAKLTSHEEDAQDHNLPLLYWYAMEPLAEVDENRALALGMNAGNSIPLLRQYTLRRLAESGDSQSIERLISALSKVDSPEIQVTFLTAIRSALAGQRRAATPTGWDELYQRLVRSDSILVQREAVALGVAFGNSEAMQIMRVQLADPNVSSDARRAALDSLLAAGDANLANTLIEILQQPAADAQLAEQAIGAMARYDDPAVAQTLISRYSSFTPGQRRAAVAALCGRQASAMWLLDAIAAGQISAADLTADLARQLEYLENQPLSQRLREVWGQVRKSSEEKASQINQYQRLIQKANLPPVDMALGRALFAKTCQRCHILYGEGQQLGPDITGSNRSNLDYLLENIVDPSAVMAKEYRQTVILTKDGQIITGIVRQETENAVTIQTAESTVVIPKDEIDQQRESEQSMMPDDQLNQFSEHQIRSLIAYLRHPTQTPLLATMENASTLFNAKDLTGWKGNPQLWSVQNGEIVGQTTGLDHNEFLTSDFLARDFKLSLEVKLVDNAGNSGVQFRSRALDDGDVAGYQADIGPGWWGKLYEEHGRGLLWKQGGQQHVKNGDWNVYEIEAIGSRIRTWINGQACVDLDDPDGNREGILALQLHSGRATEVRFRKFVFEVK